MLTGRMTRRFTTDWAGETVAQLRDEGVEFADGLTRSELDGIAGAFGAEVPPELGVFLGAAVPTSVGWTRWSDGPDVVAAETAAWIERAFRFDIVNSQYWHRLLGERPNTDEEAVDQAHQRRVGRSTHALQSHQAELCQQIAQTQSQPARRDDDQRLGHTLPRPIGLTL